MPTSFGFYVRPAGALVCVLVYLCLNRLMADQREQLVIVRGRLCVSICACQLGLTRRNCCVVLLNSSLQSAVLRNSRVLLCLTYRHVSLTHGAEPFLRSYSRTSQHFMESEGSLPCSQEPSTGPYLEPDQSNL
jgi:hypothetical protein